MYGRLSRYTLRIQNERLWEETLRRPEPGAVALFAALDGFRGVWVSRSEHADGLLDLVFFSLWETRTQAEAVRDLLGEEVAKQFAQEGVSVAAPPGTEILTVLGGRTA